MVVDVELGWTFDHEDLKENVGSLIAGVNSPSAGYIGHGTAVVGEICGNEIGFGVTGLAPKLRQWNGGSILQRNGSMLYPNCAPTILEIIPKMSQGDIMLIELHSPHPTNRIYISMEYWPDNFLAFKLATERGIIVIEAAGNGGTNFDLPIYNTRPPGFPESWRNPYNRTNADSGTIVCGAGAPPSGVHGPNLCRLSFSNYGNMLDSQGVGREVVTTGYGDLQRGTEQRFYTAQFSGTSSASPMVVGAVASLQGIAKSKGRLLTPKMAREILRNHKGSLQVDGPGVPRTQRIGSRPNMGEMVKELNKFF